MNTALLASIGVVAPFLLISLWSLWHSATHIFDTPQERLLWIIFIALVPVIGGLVYIVAGRRRARGKLRA